MLIVHQAMGQPFLDQMRQQVKDERDREEPEEVELEKGSGVQSTVGKPWYAQTYEYLKYAAAW